jgi:hypothetical protein
MNRDGSLAGGLSGAVCLFSAPSPLSLSRFHPETLLFPDVETAGFQFGIEQFFLLARKSSSYEEAYINTLTNNCED